MARVLPFWHDHIARDILDGKRVIVVAHGNSLRSIVKYLDQVTDKGTFFEYIYVRHHGAEHSN